ncbi:MAG: L-aspartate oxidase [Phycisphaeraceae bacterium]|nr:MAG: L-aspartate oxidase [Phycisphaeraceae bacterium]
MLTAYDQRRYLIPFRSPLLPQIFTDTLVIGTGVAGLRAAIEAAGSGDVIVLAKRTFDQSNTTWAQGGVAAVLASDDTIEAHVEDTLAAGAGLCEPTVVRTLAEDGAARIQELIEWGMKFDRDQAGRLMLGREGGHHHHRIAHSHGDRTGEELTRCLASHLQSLPNVRLFENCFALDLLTAADNAPEGNGAASSASSGAASPVVGAITYHPRYGLQIIWAGSTILATGGAGQVYRETTNPAVATGDGMAMAWRAGAMLADMAFVQFHPTTLYVAGASRALITEAIRGEGAYLVDREGRRFMPEVHPMAELAPRDVVSRAIIREMARTQDACVFLDVRHIGGARFAERFPAFDRLLRSFDIDAGKDLIPVHPSAHYTVGGVWADLDGATTVPGLYACGEVSCNGLHGANRLASNSLLEGLVFGRRCGEAAGRHHRGSGRSIQIVSDIRPSDRAELDLADVRSSLRSAMWRNVGIERTGVKLADALEMFGFWGRYVLDKIFDDPAGWETQNLLTVGALITRAALWREESRGGHLRIDWPEPRTEFALHDLWMRSRPQPVTRPVGLPQEAGA